MRYILGKIVAIPLLPIMYLQSRRIRATIPDLPEAIDPQGNTGEGDHPLKLILLGESTLAGIGVDTHGEGFSGTLASELSLISGKSVDWRVYAKSGYTAKMVNRLLVPKIEENKADLIVIGLGGNDTFTLNSPKQWSKDILELVLQLQSKFEDTPIVFTNMPPIREFPAFTPLIRLILGNLVEILGQKLAKTLEEIPNVFYNEHVIQLKDWEHISTDPGDFFSDGVHPSKLTYQTWAKQMANFIVEKISL